MLIKNSKPACLWRSNCLLGEGTLWVSKLQSIFFVDIKKKQIFILNIKNKRKKILKLDKEIGFIAHIKRNFFILGLQSELRIVNLKSQKTIYSISIEKKKPNNRINDGKIDPAGRLWFGTIDNLGKKKSGALYCLDKNLKLHKVDQNYFTTNGPAFLNKNNFYHTDSRKKVIYKIKINKKLKIIKKKIFIKFTKKDGSPDGMTVDKKNNLWVCHYHGSSVSAFDLKGKKIHKISIPANNITNCTFGGVKNNELFISTARKGMSIKEKRDHPLSGSLFNVKLNLIGKKSLSFKTNRLIF